MPDDVRERNRWYWLDTLAQDVSFACRLIRRSPILSAAILATLTIGIALNVSVFSLVNALLLRPWVRSDPQTFVSVFPRYSGGYSRSCRRQPARSLHAGRRVITALAAAMAAVWIPAQRAATLDPLVSLRYE